MNICGVLVHAHPAKLEAVVAALSHMAGVDLHQRADGGRLIVTVEDTSCTTAFDAMTTIHRIDGVVAASLVYHHFDAAGVAGAVPA